MVNKDLCAFFWASQFQPCKFFIAGGGKSENKEIHCDIENADKELLPGMFVNAELQLQNGEVISVPESAVVSWENKHYVFIERSKETFEMIPAEIGMLSNGFIEIKNISFDQKMVTTNAYSLLMKIKSVE